MLIKEKHIKAELAKEVGLFNASSGLFCLHPATLVAYRNSCSKHICNSFTLV